MNANPIIRRNPGRSFKTWELCGGGFVLDGLPKGVAMHHGGIHPLRRSSQREHSPKDDPMAVCGLAA